MGVSILAVNLVISVVMVARYITLSSLYSAEFNWLISLGNGDKAERPILYHTAFHKCHFHILTSVN